MARFFVAVPLAETARTGIARAVEPFLSRSLFRRVPGNNMHITLAFIGDAPEDVMVTTAKTMEQEFSSLTDTSTPPPLKLGTAGAFPRLGDPRVVWIDIIEGKQTLESLHRRVTEVLDAAAIPFDRKPFRPHLTVAYRRNSRNRADRREAANAVKSLREHLEHVSWAGGVPGVVFYRSTLTPGGAIHTPVMLEH